MTGWKALRARLSGMAARCAEAADSAARESAVEARDAARVLCPVDTGRLRNSITHQQYDDNTEVVGTNVEYGPYVELGHHSPSGKMVAGKPFLRPAAEGHAAEYAEIIKIVMSNA